MKTRFSSSSAGKKPKKYSPIKSLLFFENREWYRNSNSSEKARYRKIIKQMDPWMLPLPTTQEVMDLNCSPDMKAKLVRKIIALENYEVYSSSYEKLEQSIVREYLFLRDVEKIQTMEKKSYTIPPLFTTKINGEDQNQMEVLIPLRQRIINSHFDATTKHVLLFKCNSMEQMCPDDSDYRKLYEYIDTALNIPTESCENEWTNLQYIKDKVIRDTTLSHVLRNIRKYLDTKIYGMDRAKDEILMELASIARNPKERRILALLGPPGVGKTELARCLGEAIQLPFQQISMGGASDVHFIMGHSSTYIGSKPGVIIESLINMKYNNGIMFFDELDKQSSKISQAMLHVLDPVQNSEFKDSYFTDIPVNLSKLFFIASLNSIEKVDRKLLDRIAVISVEGYDKNDKKIIASKYLLPNIYKDIGMNIGDIILNEDILLYILEILEKDELSLAHSENSETGASYKPSSTKSGIRILKAFLKTLIQRINYSLLIHTDSNCIESLKGLQLPVQLTREMVDQVYKVHTPLSMLLGAGSMKPPEGMYM